MVGCVAGGSVAAGGEGDGVAEAVGDEEGETAVGVVAAATGVAVGFSLLPRGEEGGTLLGAVLATAGGAVAFVGFAGSGRGDLSGGCAPAFGIDGRVTGDSIGCTCAATVCEAVVLIGCTTVPRL